MRKVAALLTAALALAALAGCKSKSVSRVYPFGIDATWAAALTAVDKTTGAKPASADREKDRIVTKWTVGEAREVASAKEVDIWRGVITFQPTSSGTKVSIRIEKGVAGGQEPSVYDTKSKASVGLTVFSTSREEQNKFLNALAAELAKG